MSSARIALSRHVGQNLRSTPFRPVVGRWGGLSIKDGNAPRAIWRGIDSRTSIRWQSSVASQPIPTPPQLPPEPETSQQSPPNAKRPFYIRAPLALALTLLTFTAGFVMAGAPALESLRDIANPPTDEETLSLFVPSTDDIRAIEDSIFSHSEVKELLQDPKFIASRPHLKIPEKLRAQNLTGGTLLGEDKIAVPPLQFSTADGSQYVSFQWLGPALCGHPGIVHGGLLATLLDEGLARCCFPALPNKVGVTASLKIDYKAPCMAGQIVVLRAETTKVEGRKAWVKGRLESLPMKEGDKTVVLTEAEALFIEPRQAASMRRVVN